MADGRPHVSVFSCWYNRLREIEASVHSVLDQQGVEFEYVIVDDASTDGTSERLAAISHPRLRLMRNETNIGFTRSAIRAVAACRGNYVAVHGAGDFSLPGRLANQAAYLDSHADVVAVGCTVEADHEKDGRRSLFEPGHGDALGMPVKFTHGEVMFRRDSYDQVSGYRDIFYFTQDKDLWYRMLEIGRLEALDQVLYRRWIGTDGIQDSPAKIIRQAVFSNLMLHAAGERQAGRADPVTRFGSLALLTQPATSRFTDRAGRRLRELLRARDFRAAREALETAPAGLLTFRMLATLLVLRAIAPKR
jgi:glycosyltransferase involved in cell wall biosynthesis